MGYISIGTGQSKIGTGCEIKPKQKNNRTLD